MKIVRKPVIEDYDELGRAVEQQFNLEEDSINILDLFGEECENGTYQSIYFGENELEATREQLSRAEKRNSPYINFFSRKLLVQIYLHDILPDEDEVLWWCTW